MRKIQLFLLGGILFSTVIFANPKTTIDKNEIEEKNKKFKFVL